MQLSSSNHPSMHSQAHIEAARNIFTFSQNDEHTARCSRDEMTQEYPIGSFTQDLTSHSKVNDTNSLEHFDEADDFMPLFGCDSRAFGIADR